MLFLLKLEIVTHLLLQTIVSVTEDKLKEEVTLHTGANPFINQPFDIMQKFFDRNGSYTLRIRKIRKIRKM